MPDLVLEQHAPQANVEPNPILDVPTLGDRFIRKLFVPSRAFWCFVSVDPTLATDEPNFCFAEWLRAEVRTISGKKNEERIFSNTFSKRPKNSPDPSRSLGRRSTSAPIAVNYDPYVATNLVSRLPFYVHVMTFEDCRRRGIFPRVGERDIHGK